MKPLIKTKTFGGLNGPYLSVHELFKIKLLNTSVTLCLHEFHRGDEDPDCHDHPFHYASLVLVGGYREYNEQDKYILRKPFSFAYRAATHRHRVEPLSKRCWTLCIKFKANREWGFWSSGNFIPWKTYIKAKGLEPIADET